jgi:hypothetical protein
MLAWSHAVALAFVVSSFPKKRSLLPMAVESESPASHKKDCFGGNAGLREKQVVDVVEPAEPLGEISLGERFRGQTGMISSFATNTDVDSDWIHPSACPRNFPLSQITAREYFAKRIGTA